MKSVSLLLLSLFVILNSALAQNIESRLITWESSETTIEALKNEIDRLQAKDEDESYILVLQSILAGRENNSIQRVEYLIQLSEKNSEKTNYYAAYANYHLSAMLNEFKILPFALEYSDRAIYNASAIGNERILYLSYKTKAGIYFKMKDYKKACTAFKLALQENKGQSIPEQASDYNNVALCYYEMKQYQLALANFSKGLKLLEDRTGDADKTIYQLIRGNMGSAYVKMGEIEKGKDYLNEEAQFYRDNNMLNDNYTSTLIQLLVLADQSDDLTELRKLSHELFDGLNRMNIEATSKQLNAIDTLIYISKRKPIELDAESLNILRNRILIEHLTQKEKLHDGLTNFLYEEKIKGIVASANTEKQEVEETEHSKFIIVLILCLSFLVVMIGGYLFFRYRMVKKHEDEEAIKSRQQSLEREMENQQQQLNMLITNLKIKQQTENGFLEKIKELKRNKNATTEQVIKELQLGLTNLFDIDKKLISEGVGEINLDQDATVNIKKKHPELSQTELIMCTYFVNDLSAKEIGLLLNISDVSVRVAKNKIKNKIGLPKEKSLNDYLQSIVS